MLGGGSALLATLADIDEPNSWSGRRVRFLLSVLAGLLLGWAGWLLADTGVGVGLAKHVYIAKELRPFVGAGLGYEVLRGAQDLFGGHRRMTYSLITCKFE